MEAPAICKFKGKGKAVESEVAGEQGPGKPGKTSGPGKPFRFHSKINRKVRKSFKPERSLCGEYRGV